MSRKQVAFPVTAPGSGNRDGSIVKFYSDSGATSAVTLYARRIGGDPLPTVKVRGDQITADSAWVDTSVTSLYARLEDVGRPPSATVQIGVYDPDPVPPPIASSLPVSARGAAGGVVANAKLDEGGQYPSPFRVPTIVWDSVFPRDAITYEVCWAEGTNEDTMYAYGRDNVFRKSTDGGFVWTTKGKLTNQVRPGAKAGVFLKLLSSAVGAQGACLTISEESPQKIYRSTDDTATFTAVFTMPDANYIALGPSCWVEDQVTGYIYLAPYNATGAAAISNYPLYRSTDGGATWAVFYNFPGQASNAAASTRIRHLHSVQWDSVSQRVYISAGDSDLGGGIYRVTADSTSVEKVVTNNDIGQNPTTNAYMATNVSVAFFPNYLVWGGDQSGGGIYRLNRNKIGSATHGDVGIIYQPNSTAFFWIKASADGSKWLMSASNEDSTLDALDKAVHLYCVEDDGATVWEVGSDMAETGTAIAALAPVGQPHIHGDVFMVRSHGFGNLRGKQLRGRVARGGGSPLPQASRLPIAFSRHGWSSGQVTVPAGGSVTFGAGKCPDVAGTTQMFTWKAFSFGVYKVSGTGTVKLSVVNTRTSSEIMATTNPEPFTFSQRVADAVAVSSTVQADDVLEYRIVETGGSASAVAVAHIEAGWGDSGL